MITDTLVIIPARGGSKGIPGKNIRPLAGKPLILYTVDLARQLFPDTHIILSTDSEQIAITARTAGLPVNYMRPPELATDNAPTRDALLHAMDWADTHGIPYKKICLLQPTSPLRTADDILRCIDRYTPDIDMVTTVRPAATNPYYNCYETDFSTYPKATDASSGARKHHPHGNSPDQSTSSTPAHSAPPKSDA